jgi:hypothetical protein
MLQSCMVISGANSLRAEVLRQGLASAPALHKDKGLATTISDYSGLSAEKLRFFICFPESADAPAKWDRSPIRAELDSIKPVRQFTTISQGGGQSYYPNKRIQAAKAGNSSLQSGATSRVSKQMNLIHNNQIGFRNPRPVTAPVTSAGIKALGRHDKEIRLIVGYRHRSPLRSVITRKDTDREFLQLIAPTVCKFLGQGSKRRKVHCLMPSLQCLANRQGGEPGFSASGRHLQDAAESRTQETVVHYFLLNGVQQEILHTDIRIEAESKKATN